MLILGGIVVVVLYVCFDLTKEWCFPLLLLDYRQKKETELCAEKGPVQIQAHAAVLKPGEQPQCTYRVL